MPWIAVPQGEEEWRAAGPPPTGLLSARGRRAVGVAPGRLAAAGGNRGMRGGEASPHPSTAYVPCQLKKGTVNELLALRATGPWGVRLLRARGVPRACPRDAAYRGSVPQPEGGTSGHRHRAGLVLRGLRATRGSRGDARANVKISPRRGGKPGFPIPQRTRAGGPRTQAPAPGRVWEGAALPRTNLFSLRRCAADPHGRLM